MLAKVLTKAGAVVQATGGDVQGGGSDDVYIWDWELSGEGINGDSSRGFSSLGI